MAAKVELTAQQNADIFNKLGTSYSSVKQFVILVSTVIIIIIIIIIIITNVLFWISGPHSAGYKELYFLVYNTV
jgi:hypothetical protein